MYKNQTKNFIMHSGRVVELYESYEITVTVYKYVYIIFICMFTRECNLFDKYSFILFNI